MSRPSDSVTGECERITRKSASNLALAFILLPRGKRLGMAALYAFCRSVDDVADEDAKPVGQRRAELAAWREDVRAACLAGGSPQFPVNRELQPVITRCHLPFTLFDELIQGCEMDLDAPRYADYAALENYCYHVASVVGLLSIEIFGYRNPACKEYALHLGKALQLTNILRDVRVDAARGRIYIPESERQRFGVTSGEIFRSEYSVRFHNLAEGVAKRARHFYGLARQTLPPGDRSSMMAAELMAAVYWQLLRKIERRQYRVLAPELTRVCKAQKIALILGSWLRLKTGLGGARYGV
jgi:phytoene synthase